MQMSGTIESRSEDTMHPRIFRRKRQIFVTRVMLSFDRPDSKR